MKVRHNPLYRAWIDRGLFIYCMHSTNVIHCVNTYCTNLYVTLCILYNYDKDRDP